MLSRGQRPAGLSRLHRNCSLVHSMCCLRWQAQAAEAAAAQQASQAQAVAAASLRAHDAAEERLRRAVTAHTAYTAEPSLAPVRSIKCICYQRTCSPVHCCGGAPQEGGHSAHSLHRRTVAGIGAKEKCNCCSENSALLHQQNSLLFHSAAGSASGGTHCTHLIIPKPLLAPGRG